MSGAKYAPDRCKNCELRAHSICNEYDKPVEEAERLCVIEHPKAGGWIKSTVYACPYCDNIRKVPPVFCDKCGAKLNTPKVAEWGTRDPKLVVGSA